MIGFVGGLVVGVVTGVIVGCVATLYLETAIRR